MKAMVLAAGLGTRLRPLTDHRPKALVEINGRTLLEIALSRLRAAGVREVIVNAHHFADMIVDYLKQNQNFGMRIEVSREGLLLDTAVTVLALVLISRSGRIPRAAKLALLGLLISTSAFAVANNVEVIRQIGLLT